MKMSGKWEMIRKHPDSLSGFFVIRAKTLRMRKNFLGSNATLLPRFLRPADDTQLNFSVFLLSIVQSKFPDLLRRWSSVPHWSSTDASSQFNTKSQ